MIPTLRSPAALTAAALLLGSGPSLRAADDATPSATPVTVIVTPAPTATPDPEADARRQTAETLLETLHMQATVEAASKPLLLSGDQVADRMEKQPNATPEVLAEAKKLREDLHTLIGQGLGWEAIKPDLVQAYADDFTVAELKEIDAFYHTPVGQKLVDKQPALTERLGKAMQQRTKALFPALRQKVMAATAKTRPSPPPVPAPVGLPPAVPPPAPVATSPVPAPTAAAASATPTAPPDGTPKSITPVMPATPAPM